MWGLGQLVTGPLADRFRKQDLLFGGLLLQGAVLLAVLFTDSYPGFVGLAALLGVGTALVYPTFLAAVAEYAPLTQRARSVGIFRFWRDAGYAVGALLTGLLADAFGLGAALAAVGGLTVVSAAVVLYRMRCATALLSARHHVGRHLDGQRAFFFLLKSFSITGRWFFRQCAPGPETLRRPNAAPSG